MPKTGETFEAKSLVASEDRAFNSYSVETKGSKDYFVEGYIATHHKDKVNDVITKSAMRDIYNQADDLMVDLEHEAYREVIGGEAVYRNRETLIPVAKVVEKKIDSVGVWVKARINQHLGDKFERVWGSIQDGFLKAFSIAFAPPSTDDYVMNGDTRVLNRINRLLNVAITGIPVNDHARITNVVAKSMINLEESEMTDEEVKEEAAEEAPVEEAPDAAKEAQPTEEAPAEEAEAPAGEPAETKSDVLEEIRREFAEVKSLLSVSKKEDEEPETDLKSMLEELKELKAELKKPQLKAVESTPDKEVVDAELRNYII